MIGLVILCTDRYIEFIHQLLTSVEKRWMKDIDRKNLAVILLTNHKDLPFDISEFTFNVRLKYIEHEIWPGVVIKKTKFVKEVIEENTDLTHIYAIDADSDIVDDIYLKELDFDFCIPMSSYYTARMGDYEHNVNSAIYYKEKEEIEFYYGGSFWGGRRQPVYAMCCWTWEKLEIDISNNIIPTMNEETAINLYCHFNRPVTLGIRYHYPEWQSRHYVKIWGRDYKPKIIIVPKDNSTFHQNDKNLIIGLGTGRCGTVSLSNLLNLNFGKVFHEMQPLLDFYGKDGMFKRFHTVNGDVAFYYLNYVDRIKKMYPNVKFVYLERDREECVESWRRHLIKNGHPNAWRDEDEHEFAKTFQKFNKDTLRQNAECHWDYYKKFKDENFVGRDDFFFLATEELNDKNKVYEMLDWLGCEDKKFKIFKDNRSGTGLSIDKAKKTFIIYRSDKIDYLKHHIEMLNAQKVVPIIITCNDVQIYSTKNIAYELLHTNNIENYKTLYPDAENITEI